MDANADACPPPDDAPALAQVDSAARLEFLARTFDREIHDVDLWSWAWGGGFGAAAVAQGVAVPIVRDHGLRIDLAVGVGSASVGAVATLLLPLQLTLPLRAARRRWDDSDRCAVVARAERTLVTAEKDQALATGVLAHVGNVAVNLGFALVLGLGYGRWPSAALSGGVGVAIGEVSAFTQPHHLREALARYRTGQLGPAPPGTAWSVGPVWTGQMTGAALTLTW